MSYYSLDNLVDIFISTNDPDHTATLDLYWFKPHSTILSNILNREPSITILKLPTMTYVQVPLYMSFLFHIFLREELSEEQLMACIDILKKSTTLKVAMINSYRLSSKYGLDSFMKQLSNTHLGNKQKAQ